VTISFGFGLITCQRYPGDSRSDTDLYAQALELASQADALGLDSVWVSEHHFVDDSYMPSLLTMCAAMAARTERILVGTALLLAPLYEPVRLAEDAAAVDLISAGRLILGLGLGWRDEEFEGLAVSLRDRVPRLVDTIITLRQAWGAEAVTGGSLVTYPGLAVRPRPHQPGGPPLWIGALSEPAIRRAGSLADGFMATDVDPEQFATQVTWAREESRRRAAPSQPFTIGLHLPTFVWDEPDAFEIVRDHVRYVDWKYEDMGEAHHRTGESPAPPALATADEDRLRCASLVGTPDEVAARIHKFQQAAGGDFHFIARLYLPGLDYAIQQRTLELFAVEVVPRVRRLVQRER
jgi:alkanesulfonate monooxygenase SsuD/methylene tetrahydromethanopterin reductase-like flavin-dependent oxidoreductase (luciferase family)